MNNKIDNILQNIELIPNRFKLNIEKFKSIEKKELKDILIKYCENNNFTKKIEENKLYYDIILYLLKEWSLNNENILINEINKIFNDINYSTIDNFIDNILYNYCIKLKIKRIKKILYSDNLDIYYQYFKNYIKLSFLLKFKNYMLNNNNISLIYLYIPHNKEYNPNNHYINNNEITDHAIYIMNYYTDIYINNFLNNCLLNIHLNNIKNEHFTILKYTKGFHYSRNSNISRYLYFDNIYSIINIYIQCEIYNNVELLNSIITNTNTNLIDNRELLKFIMNLANRYFIIKNNFNMNFNIPGIFEKNEIDLFYEKIKK
jgi:hypothetical protein